MRVPKSAVCTCATPSSLRATLEAVHAGAKTDAGHHVFLVGINVPQRTAQPALHAGRIEQILAHAGWLPGNLAPIIGACGSSATKKLHR